jgi:hypothetical protein
MSFLGARLPMRSFGSRTIRKFSPAETWWLVVPGWALTALAVLPL